MGVWLSTTVCLLRYIPATPHGVVLAPHPGGWHSLPGSAQRAAWINRVLEQHVVVLPKPLLVPRALRSRRGRHGLFAQECHVAIDEASRPSRKEGLFKLAP